MRIVVGCGVGCSVVGISVVVGVSVVEVVGGVNVDLGEFERAVVDRTGSVVVGFLSDVRTAVVDGIVGVVAGGLLVVEPIAVVSLFSCLFSNTNSTISSTTLKAGTGVRY